MNQLVVLQEIYESFSKGADALMEIDPKFIEGRCSEQVGKLLQSLKQGRIDEDLCQELADCLEDVYEIKRLGDICRRAGLFALAIKCYNRALTLTKDQNVRPVLLNNLGQAYSRQGDYGRATIYYQKAADGFESAGDCSGLAHILGNLGAAYRRGKDWDKAVEHCYRSQKIFEEIGDEYGHAQMTGSLGRIYAEMGERDLASRYLEKSLKDFQRLGDKKSTARILDRMGRISARGRNWDNAIRYYNKSLIIFDEQGQSQSSGIVLSNLGRMYLEKGEAVLARDSLERAIKLMRKEMQPAYQNAIAALAASYSLIARSYLQETPSGLKPGAKKEKSENPRLASEYFARASDRYQEISSFTRAGSPEIKVAAAVNRSLSYLSRLQISPPEAEAVNLAERATSALDAALANLEGSERTRIEALQRVLKGMKEVWSAGLLGDEPWRMTKPLANATEYMIGGACGTGEASSCLCDALHSLSGAIDSEKRRADPSEQLKLAASHLRRAEMRFCAMKDGRNQRSASQTGQAALLIESLIIQETTQSTASQSHISDLLNYKAYREALLLVGWVMAEEALYQVESMSHIYAWDESFNVIKSSSKSSDIVEPGIDVASAEIDSAPDEAELEVEPVKFQEAFGKRIDVANDVAASSVKANPEGLWLIPVKSSLAKSASSSQMLMATTEYADDSPIEIIEIIDPTAGVDAEPGENTAEHMGIAEKETGKGTAKGDSNDSTANTKKELRDFKDWLSGLLESAYIQDKAMKGVKAMMVVVIVLLAIKVILYLI